jgi:hypothetical protein
MSQEEKLDVTRRKVRGDTKKSQISQEQKLAITRGKVRCQKTKS